MWNLDVILIPLKEKGPLQVGTFLLWYTYFLETIEWNEALIYEKKIFFGHRDRHRSHQHGGGGQQSRSTVEEDRIDIYNVQQQQLKQQQQHSSRPVKTGPPTKPKPNVALSRKSSKKLILHFILNRLKKFLE